MKYISSYNFWPSTNKISLARKILKHLLRARASDVMAVATYVIRKAHMYVQKNLDNVITFSIEKGT